MKTAEQVQQELVQTLAKHRANGNLSADGKQKLAAAAYLNATEQMTAIKAAGQQSTAQSRTTLERKLFGLPSRSDPTALISYRDASDRAEKAQSLAEAEALLRRAVLSEDDALARAVCGRAFEAGWTGVVDSFVTARPADAEAVDQLLAMNVADAHASSHAARFAASLFSSIPKPQELANVNDFALEQLAGQAPAPHEIPAPPAPVTVTSGTDPGWRLVGDNAPGADGWM